MHMGEGSMNYSQTAIAIGSIGLGVLISIFPQWDGWLRVASTRTDGEADIVGAIYVEAE